MSSLTEKLRGLIPSQRPFRGKTSLPKPQWQVPVLRWEDLVRATNNFSDRLRLAGYDHTETYIGSMLVGKYHRSVLIQIFDPADKTSTISDPFDAVKAWSDYGFMQTNVVSAVGYSTDKVLGTRALVFESRFGMTLHSLLERDHREGQGSIVASSDALPMSWNQRLSIAKDVAEGLRYLHKSCSAVEVIHFNINPRVILVDEDFRAHVAGFESSGAIVDCGAFKDSILLGGPPFLDYRSQRWSSTTDVHSFGILLLKLATGCPETPCNHTCAHVGKDLACDVPGSAVTAALPGTEVRVCPALQLKRTLALARRCSDKDASPIPTMHQVLEALREIEQGVTTSIADKWLHDEPMAKESGPGAPKSNTLNTAPPPEQRASLQKVKESPVQGAERPAGNNNLSGPVQYSVAEIQEATANFCGNVLGKGGYGVVYQGHLRGTPVAIKRMTGGESVNSGLLREVEVLSRVRHPHMVTLMGVCLDQDHPCLVYELLTGRDLGENLKHSPGHPPLSAVDRFRIAAEIGTALAYLAQHQDPIIHRDLKPNNIMLDQHRTAKVADWGLAVAAPATFEDAVAGTMGYIAPEIAYTHRYSVASDTYAFGVILLQLLTGIGSPQLLHRKLCPENESMAEQSPQLVVGLLDASAGPWPEHVAERLAALALKCVMRDKRQRPRMDGEVLLLLRRAFEEASAWSTGGEHEEHCEQQGEPREGKQEQGEPRQGKQEQGEPGEGKQEQGMLREEKQELGQEVDRQRREGVPEDKGSPHDSSRVPLLTTCNTGQVEGEGHRRSPPTESASTTKRVNPVVTLPAAPDNPVYAALFFLGQLDLSPEDMADAADVLELPDKAMVFCGLPQQSRLAWIRRRITSGAC